MGTGNVRSIKRTFMLVIVNAIMDRPILQE